MSLDFELIASATEYSIAKLNEAGTGELFLLSDFLQPALLTKLTDYIQTAELNWSVDPVYRTHSRTKVNWEPDTVIEETHTVFSGITDTLNTKFNRQNKFIGLNIWKDSAGYAIARHRDNRVIDIAIQIYLTSGPKELATTFEYGNSIVQADYKANSGYLADNKAGLYHYLTTPVPWGHTRYSVYGIWSNSSKS